MPSYSRVTVPANFYDVTSDQLLQAPEPQYLYAGLYLGSLAVSLTPPDELGLPGRGVTGVGANYTAEDADRLMLSNPMFTDVIGAKVDFNAQPGSTMKINRPVYANTTYTESSRRINGTSISTTPINVGSQQTSLTLFTYGGPYDSDNSRVAPYGIESFDANLGVFNASRMHGTHLKRDFHRFVDSVNVALLDLASSTVYPEGMSADDDATTAGQFPFTYEQMSRCEQEMDDANLPTFADGFRAIVLSPTQLKQLKDDPQYQRASQVFPAYNILFPGYVGSVGKFHVFRSTTLTSSANSSSVAIHYGHAIAPGALLAGMGRRPAVVPNTQDNYKQTQLVIWVADLAFGSA